METIYIRLNRRKMQVALVLMVILFFIAAFQMILLGPETEYIIGLIAFGACGFFAFYKLRDYRPQLQINSFGYSQNGVNRRTIYWSNVTGMRFKTIGRWGKGIEVKTAHLTDLIDLDLVTIDPHELYEILAMLVELPEEEREGFIRHVKHQRHMRGEF